MKVLFVYFLFLLVAHSQTSEEFLKKGSKKLDIFDYDGAIDDFTNAIKLNSKYYKAYFGRAFTYSLIKNYEAAIEDYSKAIEINPESAAFLNRAVAHSQLGLQGAIEDYNSAIELDPDSYLAYFNRGIALIHYGKKDEGCSDINKAKELGIGISADVALNKYCK